MLGRSLDITKINIVLGVCIVVLSFYTIIWHQQNYLLEKEKEIKKNENQQLMAMHKHLLIKHSEKISGAQIKNKALKELQMKVVNPKKIKSVLL